jgi:2-polyprenyl-6-methoxyphenol hydroxylase-like FAD-dependent oxidoreductase
MNQPSPSRALVLGAGISGLLAAYALARRYSSVILVDKRALGPDGGFAVGVPQSEHLHVLLKRGQLIIEELFPGLLAECAAGPSRNDWGGTTFWANPFGVHPRHDSGIETWQFSRDRLDRAILQRVRALPNVELRAGDARLLGDRAAGRITGIRLGDEELLADLVVDCRGRTTPVVEELTALGYPEPPMSRVDNELGYSSQVFSLPAGERPSWKLVYLQVRPGLVDRGGALCEIEGNRLIATLIGTGEHKPEAGQDELLAFAESLGHPELHAQLLRAKPVDKPRLWRNLGNRRRHFGHMSGWPRGLLVLGDALCSFNPVYGQGMTVAAVEAEALAQTLSQVPDLQATPWEATFQRRLESMLFIPWFMSTTEDQRNRRLQNPRLHTRVLHAYFDLVLKGAVRDPVLHVMFLRVMHMMSSPFSLLSPWAAARVAVRTLQRALFAQRPPRGPGEAPAQVELLPAPPLPAVG